MIQVLGGETLSGFVLRLASKEELKEAEDKLKQTEYTQPGDAHGRLGHRANASGLRTCTRAVRSPPPLGEYAALMSSGIPDMDGALRAAAARGTEMGSVEIDDKGLMASVTAPYEAVAATLKPHGNMRIAANKNSLYKMTVIAGGDRAGSGCDGV